MWVYINIYSFGYTFSLSCFVPTKLRLHDAHKFFSMTPAPITELMLYKTLASALNTARGVILGSRVHCGALRSVDTECKPREQPI